MTKKFFMALVALFLIVLAGKAQNNTYRMVIQMTDGTIINVGPNDLKNVNFVEGKLTVSGVSIDALLSEVNQLKQQQISQLQMQVELVSAQAALQNAISSKADQTVVDALKKNVEELKSAFESKDDLAYIQTAIENLNNTADMHMHLVADLENAFMGLKTALEAKDATLATAIENLNKAMTGKADKAVVAALQTTVVALQKAMEDKDVELATAINDAKKMIYSLQSSLEALEKKVDSVQ